MFENFAKRKKRVELEEPDFIEPMKKIESAAQNLHTGILELHSAYLERAGLDVSSVDPSELRASQLADVIEKYEAWVVAARKQYDELMVELDKRGIAWTEQLRANRLR